MIEMNRNNIRIDPMLEVDTNWNPPCIVACIELWFDVDEKFGTHTRDRDDAWINLYAQYSPVYNLSLIHIYMEDSGALTRCECCEDLFTPSRPKINLQNGLQEICPLCGEVWCE